MNLRQKLVLAGKSTIAEISCDKHLAYKIFLKAVEASLSCESILPEINSLLKDRTPSDEGLIFAVGQASLANSQCLRKVKDK